MAKKKPAAKTASSAPVEAPPLETIPFELLGKKAEDASHTLTLYGKNPFELTLPQAMPEGDFLEYGSNIGRAMEFAGWRVGDWVNYGMQTYGYKDYSKMAGVTGFTEEYLRTCASVSGRVTLELRTRVSLEKARLMLQVKNEKESVEKAFLRLGAKTSTELRNLTKGAGKGGRKRNANGGTPPEAVTADEYYRKLREVLDITDKLPQEKWPLLRTMEENEQTGRVIETLLGNLKALFSAIKDVDSNAQAS